MRTLFNVLPPQAHPGAASFSWLPPGRPPMRKSAFRCPPCRVTVRARRKRRAAQRGLPPAGRRRP